MCRIVGYIGKKLSREFVFEGLSRLEYGGYDSCGFACIQPHEKRILYSKSTGSISNLRKKCEINPIDGYIGIGHTRWATHGAATEENAHPHFDCHTTISAVHNGIIENHHLLREQLSLNNHKFRSETDTETIAHLFEDIIQQDLTLKEAILTLINTLEGAYAIVLLAEQYPDSMILIRKRSPLCLGTAAQETFISSDPLAFAGFAEKVAFLPDESFAIVTNNSIDLYNFKGQPMLLPLQNLELTWSADGKQGHEHFMLKEIYEQKQVIKDTVSAYTQSQELVFNHIGISADEIKSLKKIVFVACGTSAHAAFIARYFFELIVGIPVQVHIGSEFRYLPFFKEEDVLYMFISQSGETADTLESLRFITAHGGRTLALANVASSTIVREAQGFLLTHAGPEIAVASTKAFTAQVSTLYWFAHWMALQRNTIDRNQLILAEQDLLMVSEIMHETVERYKQAIIDVYAPRYANYKHAIFVGRNMSYPFAQEAALKLKEVSYIFTDCYPAGELKHGSIALIDAYTPVFIFSVLDPILYQKILSNAQEINARKGKLIVFAFEGQTELIGLADCAFIFPRVEPLLGCLAMTSVMQFFVYQIAKVLEKPIDKPRNLAKSVTVE